MALIIIFFLALQLSTLTQACFSRPHNTESDNDKPECGAIPPELRFDCGWSGINAEQCRNRGCCYDPLQPSVK